MRNGLATSRRQAAALFCALLIAVISPIAHANETSSYVQKRLVKSFDFEEADDGNFESLPMYWYRTGSEAKTSDPNFGHIPYHNMMTGLAGYPRYTQVGFDKPQAEAGDHTLMLSLDGGNAGAFLQVGAVPAVPNSDYLITARVRTDQLEYSRARISVCFVDGKGQLIDQSIVQSRLIKTDGDWQTIALRLPGDYATAAWISLRADLLQPTRNPDHPLGQHQVIYTDVSGRAWFDDIAIWQLPNVRISSSSRVNVQRAPHQPKLEMTVRDLTGRPLVSLVRLYNHRMDEVYSARRVVGAGRPSTWYWEPPLKKFGWYLADMTVHEMPADQDPEHISSPVARSISAFLWLGDDSDMSDDEAIRFNLQALDISSGELQLLPDLIDQTRIPTVTLSSWARDTTMHTLEKRIEDLDAMLSPLHGVGRKVQMSFTPIPETLLAALDIERDNPIKLFEKPSDHWAPLLKPILMQHGQRVHEWQLGTTRKPAVFFEDDPGGLLSQIQSELENLAPRPKLVIPWRLDQQRRSDLEGNWRYLIDVPYAIRPQQIGEHVAAWRAKPAADFHLHISTPDATKLDHPARVDDLALRMIHAWEAGAGGLSMSDGWAIGVHRDMELLPDPLLGVFSSVAHRLADRRAIRRMQLRPGLECIIFHGKAGGMLAIWNESAAQSDSTIEMFVGENPVQIDVWGNRTAIPMNGQKQVITFERTPKFIEGIDTRLMLFRASFALDEPFIESRQEPHQRVVRLYNPWPRTISGHITFLGPEKWRITPQRRYFSIAAGEFHELPVQMLFPVSEVSGDKMLTAQFDFTADRRYKTHFFTPMEVGLKDIEFDANLSLERNEETGGIDAVVTQLITNRGDRPLSLYAFANLRGFSRRERTVSGLKPGQSVVRRFRFSDAGEQLEETNIRVGLRQTSGPAVLNKVLSALEQ